MDAQVAEASYVDLSTGLDSSGNIQHKGGSLDANWTVTGAVNPLDPPNAYVVARADADWSDFWIGNGAYSSWIAANPNDATGNGYMTFTDTFNVATPSTAVIIGGAWQIDDEGTLSLNGHLLSTLQNRDWGYLQAFSTTASDFVAGLNTLTMKMTSADYIDDGARLRGWLVGAGSAVGDPTSHIATGATTNPPTLSSLLPPVLGAQTYTGDFAYHSDRVAQVPEASYVDLSTGLDSSGNIQHKGGSLDANWTVTGARNPLDPPNAYVVAPGDADWYGGWIGNGAYSSWIAANPNDATGNGNMTFTDTFDVATPSTATIIGGAWAIDDKATLSLNGHLLSTLPLNDYGHLRAFSTTASDFVAGLNTLTIQGTDSDFFYEGARLRGWLVGAGSAVGDPTSHIATGATTNPSPTLSSLLPPVLGAETYTGGLAYHSEGNFGGRDAWGVGLGEHSPIGHGPGS